MTATAVRWTKLGRNAKDVEPHLPGHLPYLLGHLPYLGIYLLPPGFLVISSSRLASVKKSSYDNGCKSFHVQEKKILPTYFQYTKKK